MPRWLHSTVRSPLAWAAVAVFAGVLLRAAAYLSVPSLWTDELFLALNVVHRSYSGLLQTLDFEQAAPIGYLWVQHALVQLFGANEYALRIQALIAGIVALPLTWLAARRFFGAWPAALSAALLSFAPYCIRYSNEAKQYGIELCVAAALLALASFIPRRALRTEEVLSLTLAGIVALAFSLSSAFILAGIGALLAIRAHRRDAGLDDWSALCAAGAAWCAAFVACSALMYETAHGEYMQRFWAPLQLRNLGGLKAAAVVATGFLKPVLSLQDRIPLPLAWLGLALFLTGAIVAIRTRRADISALLLAPLGLTIVAALVEQWIFVSRLLLFSAPIVAMLIAEGAWKLAGLIHLRQGRAAAFAAAALVLMLFPLKGARFYLRQPEQQSMRDAVRFCLDAYRPGDTIYLHARALPAWIFYSADWRAPDPGRFDWLINAAKEIGPNSGNSLPRGHAVEDEGWYLRRSYHGGWELVGVSDGIVSGLPFPQRPDPLWAENEYGRITSHSTGRVILMGFAPPASDLPELFRMLERSGGRQVSSFKGREVIGSVYEIDPGTDTLRAAYPRPEN